MRRFIRHPVDIPISYHLLDKPGEIEKLKNVSRGGLCFKTHEALPVGTAIRIEIPACQPKFESEGTVVWCSRADSSYDIGVQFGDCASEFNLRMVEQVCYIEHYKNYVWEKEGRRLTGEEAASEWIQKYAAVFPS
jgi:hypothetical protein